MGMALLFILSGLLIGRFLLAQTTISHCLIRWVFRVVPLAWLAQLLDRQTNLGPLYEANDLLFREPAPFNVRHSPNDRTSLPIRGYG